MVIPPVTPGLANWDGPVRVRTPTPSLTPTNASPGTTYCPSDGEANCFIVSDGALGGSGVRASTVQVDTFGFIQQVEDSYGSIWTMTYDGSQDLHTITGPNGVATNTYQYNTTLASPMEHSMSHVIDPDYNNATNGTTRRAWRMCWCPQQVAPRTTPMQTLRAPRARAVWDPEWAKPRW